MEKKENSEKFVLYKAKASMPTSFDLQYREESMIENQKQSYIKIHQYRDRFLTGEGRVKSYSHLKGKMWFIDKAENLDFVEIRIDIETSISMDIIFTGSITVQKVSFFHKNKVLSITDYERETSEMESVKYRTYPFTSSTFILLAGLFTSIYKSIWYSTMGLNPNFLSEFPNYTIEDLEKDISEDDYKIKEDDSEEVLEYKNKLIMALKAAYNKNFIPMMSGSKLYSVQPGIAKSSNKKENTE